MSHKENRGFTLIELLTVIGIIGILAAILLPTIARVRAQAQSTKCMNHLHQIGIALHTYANDYKSVIPIWVEKDDTGPDDWGTVGSNMLWDASELSPQGLGLLDDYLEGTRSTFFCPSEKIIATTTLNSGTDQEEDLVRGERRRRNMGDFGEDEADVFSSYIYRGRDAAGYWSPEGVFIPTKGYWTLEEVFKRALVMDYNVYDTCLNHKASPVHILYGSGSVLKIPNSTGDLTMEDDSEDEKDRVFLQADKQFK